MRVTFIFAAAWLLTACGSASGPAAAPPPAVTTAAPPAPPKPIPRTDSLATAQVYDDHGAASVCGPPARGCEPLPASNDFLDQCRLLGFRVLQCSCQARCTGDVVSARKHYDAAGQPKDCPPARADCTPPPPGAAFQDACAEHGFRLDTCGCEMLCSGDFKR